MRHDARTRWGIAGLCLTAFLVTAILSGQVFGRVPHSEDEVAYIFQAKVFAQNRLSVPTPQNRQAFWTPFVVDYQGQRFGKYPPGWPLLLSLGERAGVPWLVNPLLAAFTLALVAWLGKCFYDPGTSLWAVGLGLVTPGFLLLSGSWLSHTTSLFWITLSLVALYYVVTGGGAWPAERNAPRSQSIFALVSGLALGAAFITRPFAALGVGLAWAIFLPALVIRRELNWTALLWLGLAGLLIAGLLPLYWRRITGDPLFNPYLLVWPYDRLGFGPDVGPYGYGLREAIFINTRLKLTALATGLFGWPGWSNLLFLSIPFLTRRANRRDWLLLSTILGLVGVHVFYWAFGGVDGGFPRYYYDALPALLLLTARGIQISGEYLSDLRERGISLNLACQRCSWRFFVAALLRMTSFWECQQNLGSVERVEGLGEATGGRGMRAYFRGRKIQLRWLPAALVFGLIGYNLIWNLPPLLAAQQGKYNITPAPLQVVEQANLPEPALVFVKDVESWSDFAAPFAANSPTLDGPVVYAIDQGPQLNQRVRSQFEGRTCWELQGKSLSRCP